MVDKRDRHSRIEPYVEPRSPAARSETRAADSGSGRGGGDSLQRSPWRQWRSEPASIDTSPPLEVTAPKRPQYGRVIYMAIIFGIAFYALQLMYTHFFWLNAAGTIGGQQFKLSPSQTVKVESVMVEPAQEVIKGQPLIAFSNPQLEHDLAQTLMAIAELEHNIAMDGRNPGTPNSVDGLRAEIQALEAEQQFLADQYNRHRDERVDPLSELVAQGAIGRASLHEAEREMRQIMAEYEQAAAKLRGMRGRLHELQRAQTDDHKRDRLEALERLRATLEARQQDMVLKAPSDGVIARVPVEPGETLSAGDETVLLVHRESLRSYLYFPPAASSRLAADQTLAVTLPSGYRIQTRVSRIYPSIQAVPEEAWPPDAHANSASLVVAVEPANDEAAQSMRQLESGTPVSARVPRWALPDLDGTVEAIAALFSRKDDAVRITADAGR